MGVVTDPSNSVVPDALVDIRDEAKGELAPSFTGQRVRQHVRQTAQYDPRPVLVFLAVAFL